MSNTSLSIHRETDALKAAVGAKKKEYWRQVVEGILPLPEGKDFEYAQERYDYWTKYFDEYEGRIVKHIEAFKEISNPFELIAWLTNVVSTVGDIIKTIVKAVG